jgi:hypothetical protein
MVAVTFENFPEDPNQLLVVARLSLPGQLDRSIAFFCKGIEKSRLEGINRNWMWSV